MKIYFRKKTLVAKIEDTYGTDAAPTGAANAIQTRDLTIQPLQGDALEMQLDKPNFGSDLGTLVGKHVQLTFKVPLAGSAAVGTAPSWGVLMKLCGHSETVVAATSVAYAPIDSSIDSATLYMLVDSVLHKITGARGSVRLTTQKREYPWLEFTVMGLFQPVTAGVDLNADYSAWIKPVPFRATTVECSLFGQVVGLHQMTLDFGQQVEFYEQSEDESIQITDRKAKFDASFEETDVGTHNFFNDVNTDATGALSYAHGITAGNIVTITSPRTQPQTIERTDEQGVAALHVTGPLVASADLATPDYTITVT